MAWEDGGDAGGHHDVLDFVAEAGFEDVAGALDRWSDQIVLVFGLF